MNKIFFLNVFLLLSILAQGQHFFDSQLNVLNKSKELINSKKANYLSAYNKLIAEADNALNEGPFSVMNKKLVPPSGDKHDYLSLAPYFWPDPSKPDGKPYLRKDGEVNPETRGNYVDYTEKGKLFDNVNTLGYAYFFSDDNRYAQKATQLLKTWFVDPATRMNPNLNFGQGVPGTSTGRPFGVIEFSGIGNITTCLEILKNKNALPSELEKPMREWLKEYAAWLENSTIGKAERATLNNHGTHYDEQLATILIYLGEIEKVKQILESVKSNRIAAQIEPDGKQPRELERTKAFSYSTMNLSGMIALAQLGQVYGIDLWNYETNDGRSIKKAINFLIPFANNPEKWEYDQIASMEDSVHKFKLMVGAAAYRFNDPFLKEFAQKDLTKADGLFLLTNPLYAE